MALQQRQRQGRLGEDPDSLGPAYVDRVGVTLAARQCAIRSHIATKKITSPALARTIRVFSPNSSDWPVVTNRASDCASRRASAASGSASMIRASTRR